MKKFLLLVFCIAGLTAFAQNTPITTANYDLAERFSPQKVNRMVFSTAVSPNWMKKSNRFWYEYSTPAGKRFYSVDANTGQKRDLFDPAKMAADVSLIVKDPFDAQHLPVRDMKFTDDETKIRFGIQSSLRKETPDEIGNSQDNRNSGSSGSGGTSDKKIFWFEYDLQSQQLTHLEDFDPEKKYPKWANISPDGQTILFMKHHNLYWMDRENFEKARKDEKDTTIVEHKVTEDGEEHFQWGGEYYSIDNETNVDKKKNVDKRYPFQALWSPDSRHFVIVRTDYRKIEDLWVINSIASPRPTLQTYRYHMAGEPNAPQEYLYVFDNATKTPKMVNVSAFKDQTLGISRKPILQKDRSNDWNPAIWLGFNDKFYINRTSRDLKRIDIVEVDVHTATAKAIIEERLNTYVELRPLVLIESTGELIHWSERTGWGHWYLYDSKGNLKNAITSGAFHCESIAGVNPRTRTLFFNAMGREEGINPYYQFLYSVNLNGSGLRLLTRGDFSHSVSMNDDCTHYVATYSRVNTIPKSELADANGRVITLLETADLSRLFEHGYQFPEPFSVKASDGITDLYGVMYKPFDFDSTKLYPLVQYVYPGPQTEAVNFTFSQRMDRTDRLAQMGMIVITVGNLGGHPHRGKWYHNYGYGNLRDYGLRCKITAAQQLAARHNFIDINKVGITGHSGGGFMSTAAILKYPDFFKVAVSNAGNHDNNIYNRWWSEKHHGILEEIITKKDSAGVVTSSDTTFKYTMPTNQALANNLKGKLLLTTGEIDENVHPAGTMRVVNALIRANKRFDLMVFPTQRHGYGDMTEYYFWLMADYFSEHLIGDSEKHQTDIRQMNRW
ncbi:MAG: S9 family peptidase [Bacteroidales bacterium]|nr:S9 family peptidase [Bacteroidales bacterium]